MAAVHSIFDLSEHLFWDVNKADLDFEKSKEFIIHRVLEYGLMEDWELIKEIYGLETIKQTSLLFRELDAVTLSFLSAIFDIDKKEFRCYTHKTSMPSFWNS
ncbi:DUF6922 domain-containing protein [Aequorivita sp. CIP111184]|uniref:DUF6922 domain-containing protein n=1 Tax=Aequorivita sp. CIP111184 TaxID=2211356 RepID=UPI000DBC2AFC|nr:hypothetical protein [Aequorivita sp. CIP111184]SRX52880.1 hypothetical protein AEQU1_00744 [Aequorivita sp. CIP111184]